MKAVVGSDLVILYMKGGSKGVGNPDVAASQELVEDVGRPNRLFQLGATSQPALRVGASDWSLLQAGSVSA